MKRQILILIAGVLLGQSALADHPATSFWLVKKDKLDGLLSTPAGTNAIDASSIAGISACQGYFKGDSCDVWLQEATVQFRLTARITEGTLTWGLWLYRSGEDRSGGDRGSVKVADGWLLPADWKTLDWVVVFRKVNLKE